MNNSLAYSSEQPETVATKTISKCQQTVASYRLIAAKEFTRRRKRWLVNWFLNFVPETRSVGEIHAALTGHIYDIINDKELGFLASLENHSGFSLDQKEINISEPTMQKLLSALNDDEIQRLWPKTFHFIDIVRQANEIYPITEW